MKAIDHYRRDTMPAVFEPRFKSYENDGVEKYYENPKDFGEGFAECMAKIDKCLLVGNKCDGNECDKMLPALLAETSSTSNFWKMGQRFFKSRLTQIPRLRRN